MMTDELPDARHHLARDRHGGAERSAIADRASAGGSCWSTTAISYERLAPILSAEHTVDVEINPAEALFHARRGQLRSADRFAQPGNTMARLVQPGAFAGAYPPAADPRHLRCQ